MNTRAITTQILERIIYENDSLNTVLPEFMAQQPPEASLIQEICYGVLRWYPQLTAVLKQLLASGKVKDNQLHVLLLIGLYQLIYLRIPEHAAVNETVTAAKELKLNWASKLVNGVLRNFLRNKESILAKANQIETAKFAHPKWLIDAIKAAWPQHWQAILNGNNEHAPLSLRVNLSKISRDDYLALLLQQGITANIMPHIPSGIILEKPVPVAKLPEFSAGLVSVQDGASQIAATLLQLQPNQRVLDACAAPGGKTSHILELQSKLTTLIALDNDGSRLSKIHENLNRLKLSAELIEGDAATPHTWWDKELFDRILLDAPCSATGVIRRHPDIKLLRRANDINSLAQQQLTLLTALWPLLKPGGLLVYSTCSILPQENQLVLTQFMQDHADATEQKINAEWGQALSIGRQILPGQEHMDGFYYACLKKL